ncbi:MAG: hypothetical protein UV20_C0040G0011 [Candidatus Magasanikbacteria bacterium GW2011_GWA2_42_32]|uniref:Uncharacterized protein n=1 Tax=Candidatus Magasanikbacteria bacterium GW2011_GWA2_42_32 TaxID=1619039 RepID=A0A0G0ZZH9_9BACT|nr:MAG: hypothetical protein UV20_C0040G0011 [Candidatus Magasanikbacteria bacterium GW2011_GWA2_42_32]
MQNNAYQIEPFEKRLARFKNGSPVESIETLLNSIDNFFNNEIILTSAKYQTSLLFLGIHSVALTISEIFWDLSGEVGFKKFLETFMDGDTENIKFSFVSDKIHSWRNILAHQWLASSGYEIQYDYEMKAGFEISDNLLRINPKIYCEQYIKAFSAGGKIWGYDKLFTTVELENAKQRIIDKFEKK